MSRDAFAVSADMLSTDAALERLLADIVPVSRTETVSLAEARGRVLARAVVSDRMVPPHDNAAVDGYAVRFADLAQAAETSLPVTMRIAAGDGTRAPLRPGGAARIFTGAPVPAGADTVIPQEPCRLDGGRVVLPPVKAAGANLRKAGEDIRVGDVILASGARLGPAALGMLASIGHGRPEVFRRLRVAVFSTGNEVRDAADAAEPGAIQDSNRPMLRGLLEDLGCLVTDLGILPDDPATIRDALAGAGAEHDAIVTSGGVSTGEEDHVKPAVEAAGGMLHFWRVAIRPGRPLAMGRVGRAMVMGLPGNPVAAFVTFSIFARPMLLKRMGRGDLVPERVPARAGFAFRKRAGRREWLRAWLSPGPDGVAIALRFPVEGSGILRSVVETDGLLELPDDLTDIAEGQPLWFLPYSALSR